MSEPANVATNREFVIARTFDAPRELVWKAWTEPERVVVWWGPKGFMTTNHEMDVRPGGVWRFTMHGPDSTDYENTIVFVEVVEPERLVYDRFGGRDDAGIRARSTVTFVDQHGKTRVTIRSVFDTQEQRDNFVKEYRAIEGGNQAFDKLAACLASA